ERGESPPEVVLLLLVEGLAEGAARRQAHEVAADRRLPVRVEATHQPEVGSALTEAAAGHRGPPRHPLALERGVGPRGGVAEPNREVRPPDLRAVPIRGGDAS